MHAYVNGQQKQLSLLIYLGRYIYLYFPYFVTLLRELWSICILTYRNYWKYQKDNLFSGKYLFYVHKQAMLDAYNYPLFVQCNVLDVCSTTANTFLLCFQIRWIFQLKVRKSQKIVFLYSNTPKNIFLN